MYMGVWKLMSEKQKEQWIKGNKDRFLGKLIKGGK